MSLAGIFGLYTLCFLGVTILIGIVVILVNTFFWAAADTAATATIVLSMRSPLVDGHVAAC